MCKYIWLVLAVASVVNIGILFLLVVNNLDLSLLSMLPGLIINVVVAFITVFVVVSYWMGGAYFWQKPKGE